MTTADQTAKEQYEKQFIEPLISEEAVMLLDPSTVKSELAYYEHGYDRITFTIKGLEYSIPGCLPTLPTLYFVGFNRVAASGIFAEFQTIEYNDFDDSVLSIFKMIILDQLLEKVESIQAESVSPKTTREALDYIGLSDEAQTNVLRLRFPREQPAEFMLRQLAMRHAARWAFRYVHRRLSVLTRLDDQIKKRGGKHMEGNQMPVDLSFLAEEIENKYMDSQFAYSEASSAYLQPEFIDYE